ncbi:MAG: GNAT family N-acetyltransferase [Proteobacteria bacterium]|nr:GNAT family N-acetyltransferase [Pseudomonadota bacterium]
MNPLIRLGTETDLPALHALVHSAYRGDSARGGWTHEADLLDGQRTDMAALAAMLHDPAQRILVAEEGGALTGCVAITDRGDGVAYLGMLSTDPLLQGKGLGRQLIAAAEQAAAGQFGATSMEMTVIRQRAELIAYYERRGYALTGEERPFPLDDPRFGIPKRRDLSFVVLAKTISRA